MSENCWFVAPVDAHWRIGAPVAVEAASETFVGSSEIN